MNMAEQLILKIEEVAAEYYDDYFMGFDGDYKEAAVIEQRIFVDTCVGLEVTHEVTTDASTQPREWQVRVTATDGSIYSYPQRG